MSWSPEVFIGEFRPWPDSVHVVRGRTGETVRYIPERTCYKDVQLVENWNTRASETPNRERIIELVEELSDLVGGV